MNTGHVQLAPSILPATPVEVQVFSWLANAVDLRFSFS
jgi:hypothetical protein